ncbi:MAG TPA: PucR family transcriptional regulator ligand-binding domain-containing protein, partial [Solirubrobacterales bacterium]|nr:PucR family transcriptional regulator ligand-binding domain-containing protein [Solirubrobacterales bacterium]
MLTVQSLLDELDLELAAGADAAAAPVRWVHISELEDPTPWLSGGELMLTTGIPLANAAKQRAFIRLLADRIGIESIDREGHLVVLKFRPEAKLDPTWLFKIVQERKDLQLTPPATLRLDMKVAGRPAAGRSRSWWTARATAGEVTGGFSRDEILRPAIEDPRAEGGVFSRVSGL